MHLKENGCNDIWMVLKNKKKEKKERGKEILGN
jgi:hypothetical protein